MRLSGLTAEILVVIMVSTGIECAYSSADMSYASMLAAASGGAYQNTYGQRSLSLEEAEAHLQGGSKSTAAQDATAAAAAALSTSARASSTYQYAPYGTYQYSNPAQYIAAGAAAAQYTDGQAAQYAAMDASGMANVKIKLDLHVLFEKLNMIPTIEQALITLNHKVDNLLNQNPNAGLGQQIAQLERMLLAKLQDQDNTIKVMLECCQQTAAKLGTVGQQLSQILTIITSMHSSGFGSLPQCDLSRTEAKITGLAGSLASLIDMIRRMNSQLDLASLLKPISKNLGLTEQALATLQQIGQPGYLCPSKSQPTKTELQMLQELAAIISTLQGIPQTIISSWDTSHKSQTSQILPYVAKLQQWIEHTASQVAGLRTTMKTNTADIKRYFMESQKSLIAVKKIVTETTEVVQNSAAAATAAVASASRSLCRQGKRRDDLAD